MDRNKLSVLYFPTTVYLLDDNKQFVDSVAFELSKTFNVQFSTEPETTKNYLVENQLDLKDLFVTDRGEEVDSELGLMVNFNFENICKIHNKINAYESVCSCLIIDYSMPTTTGIEFCRELRSLAVKRIMLTGEGDNQLAVDAFNNHLIDGFVQKNSENMYIKLAKIIAALQKDFFKLVSKEILPLTQIVRDARFPYEAYKKVFDSINMEHTYREYYLLDQLGSYVFYDSDSNPTYLIVRDKMSVEQYVDIAQHANWDEDYLAAMREYKKCPILITDVDKQLNVCDWANSLRDIIPLENGGDYFYCIV